MKCLRPRREILVGHANTIHDVAICIMEEDRVYAEALERHMQCKRAWEGHLYYSKKSILNALSESKISPVEDANVTSLSTWDSETVRLPGHSRQSFSLVRKRTISHIDAEELFDSQMASLLESSEISFFPTNAAKRFSWTSKTIDHHLTHAANAVYTSPFEECVVAILDGAGEQSYGDFFHFTNNQFHRIPHNRNFDPTSVASSFGKVYGIFTQRCGFSTLEGEEWKLMGLAAYGQFREDLNSFFKERISVNGLEVVFKCIDSDSMAILERLVGGFRSPKDPDVLKSADLAHNFQLCFGDALLEVLSNLAKLGLSENLAFAGGCALNSSVNGKILERTTFRRLHVPCAPADDGNALGAALYENHALRQNRRTAKVFSPYLGSSPDQSALNRIKRISGAKFREFENDGDLCEVAAQCLAEGKIIGWMQGRAEFGPRALGNRSILADPRPGDMKDKINAKVKFREEYRPLAPSILHEYGNEYFEKYDESPYMDRALSFREEVRRKVPAVVHEDGTGRLQTVKAEWNPLFHKLISRFHEKTGIPLVLNTSFNVMGKPIVHSIEDAMTVFYTTGLDCLFINNVMFYK